VIILPVKTQKMVSALQYSRIKRPGKKAIIIGGTSGIGLGLAKALLTHGYEVSVTGVSHLSQPELKALNLSVQYLDGTRDQLSEKLTELISVMGGLDLLVFSAGVGRLNGDSGVSEAFAANELNIQFFTEVAEWSFRFFRRQGHGHFVAISSLSGLFGSWVAPAYHAAKAYQISYLESLQQNALRARQAGIDLYVTDIRPGFVDTPMTEGKKMFWVASKEKVGRQILYHIEQRSEYAYVTKRWQLIAWIIRALPFWLRVRIFAVLTNDKPTPATAAPPRAFADHRSPG
jgi:short-subunit dehydrogenase